ALPICQRPTEAGNVRSSFVRTDVVHEGEHILRVAVVVAHRQFHRYFGVFVGDVDRTLVDGLPGLVEILDKLDDAAFEMVLLLAELFLFPAAILDAHADAALPIGEPAQTGSKRIEPAFRFLEDPGIRPELHFRARFLVLAQLAQSSDGAQGTSLCELLLPYVPVPANGRHEIGRQRIHARNTDAMETARHLIGILVELAAGMKRRHHVFQCRAFLFWMLLNGNAAAVVDDGYGPVLIDDDLDMVAIPREGLIDRVVDDFVNEVV